MISPAKVLADSVGALLFATWTGIAAAALLLLAFTLVVSTGMAQAQQARLDLTALGDSTWRCKMLQGKTLRDECLQRLDPLSRPVASLDPQR